MPKLPGRKPTRVTLDPENVEVLSFIGAWEKYAQGKRCCIEGCGHSIAGRLATREEIDEGGERFIQCEGKTSASGAAVVADKRDTERRGHRGLMICPCCLAALDEAWRAQNGDPE